MNNKKIIVALVSILISIGALTTNCYGWTELPGKLKQVSVGRDGEVWGVSELNKVYRLEGIRGRNWKRMPGALKQISVGNKRKIWGISPFNTVYMWHADQKKWIRKPGTLKQVSVGYDGTVWGVAPLNKVYRWEDGKWKRMPGALKQISVGKKGVIWGLSWNSLVYKWNPSANKWDRHIENGKHKKLKYISVGADGTVWGVSKPTLLAPKKKSFIADDAALGEKKKAGISAAYRLEGRKFVRKGYPTERGTKTSTGESIVESIKATGETRLTGLVRPEIEVVEKEGEYVYPIKSISVGRKGLVYIVTEKKDIYKY